MTYDFLVDSYATERVKVVSVWSMFRDEELPVRPNSADPRGRSVHEQMVHQCVSEDFWFKKILGVDVAAPPLPAREVRWEFMARYAEDSGKRLAILRSSSEPWWEETVSFFDVPRSRAWVITRRMTHTSQHRGHAAHAGSRYAQHIWTDGRYRRLDAESCADHLCLSVAGGDARGRVAARWEIGAAGARRCAGNGAALVPGQTEPRVSKREPRGDTH
jgi:hypothetical protein